jgi:hypothetical protein
MELDRSAAELLFQVPIEREEKNSVAIASDELFSKALKFQRTCARWRPRLRSPDRAGSGHRPRRAPGSNQLIA